MNKQRVSDTPKPTATLIQWTHSKCLCLPAGISGVVKMSLALNSRQMGDGGRQWTQCFPNCGLAVVLALDDPRLPHPLSVCVRSDVCSANLLVSPHTSGLLVSVCLDQLSLAMVLGAETEDDSWRRMTL